MNVLGHSSIATSFSYANLVVTDPDIRRLFLQLKQQFDEQKEFMQKQMEKLTEEVKELRENGGTINKN